MSDYSDIISRTYGTANPALPQTVGSIDDDPDKAQRAYDLSRATGVPSIAVYGDLDEFERQNKAKMASDIVANNPHLSAFVQSDPMVPKIANDDYGTLDSVSQKVSAMQWMWQNTKNSLAAMSTAPEGFTKGFGQGGIGSWISPEDWDAHPVAARIAAGALSPVELAMRTIGGVTTEFATELLGKEYGEKAAEVAMDPGTQATLESMGPVGEALAAPLALMSKFRPVEAWIKNGKEPPPGLMPELDKTNVDLNKQGLDQLKEATSEAQQSLLRDRNPELFRQFIANHTDAEIGVSGDAVAALYGDKLPNSDDGLLGWVPEIQSKLDYARATGDDISIPLANWLAHAEPEVMQALHDDIRVRPGGITANEAKLAAEAREAEEAAKPEGEAAPQGEPGPIPEPVPATRDAAALEPLLSVGDRKLSLMKLANADPRFGEGAGFHDFEMQDEKGNTVGGLNIYTQNNGKQLYVENITGVNGLGPRDFGPALMRDLLRQIKEQFPEAETITGHRVSGARDVAGSYMKPSAMPVIKLDNPKGWETAGGHADWQRILEGGQWETFSPSTQAYIKPYAERSVEDRRLIDAISQELDRVVPNKLGVQEADRIQVSGVEGQRAGDVISPTGTYIPYRDAYPMLLYSLEGPDPLGTARHEAIHHLRGYGFFKPEEWAALEKASKENGWVEQFGIDRRYPTAGDRLRLEESIADAYKNWEAGRIGTVPPEVEGIFARMKEFFDNLRKRIGELLGKEPNWEDIFQKVSTGEVGAREAEPIIPGAFNERLSAPEDPSRIYERANTFGIPVEAFKQYDKLIQTQFKNDLEAAQRRAMEEQGRSQTKAWKEERKGLRQEVSNEIKGRPDVAADLFLGAGELYGKKVPMADVRLDASKLNDAQKAMLPRNYYGVHGLDPDDVANLFGYGSGDAMIERLGAYNVPKLLSKMSAKDYLSRVTDIETDRQMEMRHGVLENNIMDAAKEQALGEVGQDIVHEETLFYASKIGQQPASRANIKAAVQALFKQTPVSAVDSSRMMAKLGQMGRQIEAFHRAGDWASAFQLAQKREFAMTTAAEMVKVEKDLDRFDKTAKRFSARTIPSVDQEYTNFIHDIMVRVGKPVRRSIQDIETEIAAGEYKTLPDFVQGKETTYLREVAVADILLDPAFRKSFNDLTVDEFQAIKTSIDSMIANGRDEKKITKAGEEADLNEIKGQMINQLQQFQEQQYDAKGGRWMGPIPPAVAKVLRTYGIAHIQMENLFNRWDHDNPTGVFQQYVMRDLVNAANSESAKRKVYANKLLSTDDKADLRKSVDNPLFKVPNSDQVMQFNRGNLRAIMMNVGNASNLDKLARGYGLEPNMVMAWIHKHATKEDWDWAQKVGDIFADLKGEADQMYRHISGVAPESIPIEPIQTLHGEYKGWYYPMMYHPEFEGAAKKLMGKDALEQDSFVRATTANSYTKQRTGYAGPMALDLDMMPARISQMIHDIEMRPAVINASKIFYDRAVRAAISKHFGNEWRDMLVPYLSDVANSANYMPKDQRQMYNISEFMRQNVISTFVGLNPGTVAKHGPTALVQSLHEVGPVNFLKALKSLTSINERTGESNWQFAMKNSEELQRRHQNYIETLGGATDLLQPTSGYAKFRSTIQRLSASPVAISDLLSAVPTWLAQYAKSSGDGLPHGDAMYMADRAVRRAHGSVAITNRSAVMRGGAFSQWLSSVYGFFNHIMNRQYEMLWKAGEMVGDAKEGNYREAMQQAPELTSMLFAYVLAPAMIEEMVTPLISNDNESWGKKAAKGIAFTLGASWVGIRDVANAILNGRDPSVGLISTGLKTITDFARDLGKQGPFSKEHAGKVVRDGATLLGGLTGVVPSEVGKAAQFGMGVQSGLERPRGPWGWLVGARYGTLKGHSATFQDWQRRR